MSFWCEHRRFLPPHMTREQQCQRREPSKAMMCGVLADSEMHGRLAPDCSRGMLLLLHSGFACTPNKLGLLPAAGLAAKQLTDAILLFACEYPICTSTFASASALTA